MYGHIVCYCIVSSCQSAATSDHESDYISADLSSAQTSFLHGMVSCRFHGSRLQPAGAMHLLMPVHLLGTLFQTFANAAYILLFTYSVLFGVI